MARLFAKWDVYVDAGHNVKLPKTMIIACPKFAGTAFLLFFIQKLIPISIFFPNFRLNLQRDAINRRLYF